MPLMFPARRDAIFFALAIAVVGLMVGRASQQFAIGFPLDDSWIHQTYARNLALEGEWAFVPGEASTASTSPLYTVILAIGHRLGMHHFAWAFALGALALGLAGSLAARISEIMFPKVRYVGWLTGFITITAWHLAWAAASGMETMLFMALGLAVIYLSIAHFIDDTSPMTWQRGLPLGIAGGLLTLTRPEGFGLLGIIGLVNLVYWRQSPSRYLGWAVAVAVGWVIVVTPYAAWNYDLTGDLLPATASAKVAETAPFRAAPLWERYLDMLLPLSAGGQLALLPGIVAGIWLIVRQTRQQTQAVILLVPALWALAHLTLFVIRLPAPFQHGRYVIPIVPPLLLYGIAGMAYWVERYRGTMLGRVVTRTLAISSFIAFPAFLPIGSAAYANDVRIINTEMVETAKWVADHVPPDELLAVHDIGAIGFFAPRPILDLAGLVSPELVPIINDYPAQMDLVCEREAQWLMVLPDQRPVVAIDERIELAYESPYNFADEARGVSPEPWKMRVYRVKC